MLLPWRISKSNRFNLLSVTVMRLKLRSLYGIWQSSARSEPAPFLIPLRWCQGHAAAVAAAPAAAVESWVLGPSSWIWCWCVCNTLRLREAKESYTDRQTVKQADRPTNRQTRRQAYRQTDRQTRGRTDRQLKMYTPRYELLYVSATRESFWLLRSLASLASQICLGYGAWLCDVDTPDSISQLRGSLNKCVCAECSAIHCNA